MKRNLQGLQWRRLKTREDFFKKLTWIKVIIDLKNVVSDPRVAKILTTLCYGAIRLDKEISLSDTGGGHRLPVGLNSDGDSQKQLDVIAYFFVDNQAFQQHLPSQELRKSLVLFLV